MVQLLCPVPTGRAQHVSVSVIGGVIELGEIYLLFAVFAGFYAYLNLDLVSWWSLAGVILVNYILSSCII